VQISTKLNQKSFPKNFLDPENAVGMIPQSKIQFFVINENLPKQHQKTVVYNVEHPQNVIDCFLFEGLLFPYKKIHV